MENVIKILGCKNGFIEHNFNKHSGKCEYCQILGCNNGIINHNFNENSGKCTFCNFTDKNS